MASAALFQDTAATKKTSSGRAHWEGLLDLRQRVFSFGSMLGPTTPSKMAGGSSIKDVMQQGQQAHEDRPPRPKTPLSVSLLFGHDRRHPLPHELRRAQQGTTGSQQCRQKARDPWAAALQQQPPPPHLAGNDSRPTSVGSSKRGSRGRKGSLERFVFGGAGAGPRWRWGSAAAGGEEEKAGDGLEEAEEDLSSYYHSLRDEASSLASCSSSVGSLESKLRDGGCCWVRTGELSSDDEEGTEADDAASTFREVALEEGGG